MNSVTHKNATPIDTLIIVISRTAKRKAKITVEQGIFVNFAKITQISCVQILPKYSMSLKGYHAPPLESYELQPTAQIRKMFMSQKFPVLQ